VDAPQDGGARRRRSWAPTDDNAARRRPVVASRTSLLARPPSIGTSIPGGTTGPPMPIPARAKDPHTARQIRLQYCPLSREHERFARRPNRGMPSGGRMTHIVLGADLSDHGRSACLAADDSCVVGVGKERQTRSERDDCSRNHFDDEGVEHCLSTAGLSIEDVSLIVQNGVLTQLSDATYYETLNRYDRSQGTTPRFIDIRRHPVKVISQHLAHAYPAYLPSESDHEAILIIDSMGNEDHSIGAFFKDEDSEYLRASEHPFRPAMVRNLSADNLNDSFSPEPQPSSRVRDWANAGPWARRSDTGLSTMSTVATTTMTR
jgi:hypothetical protein